MSAPSGPAVISSGKSPDMGKRVDAPCAVTRATGDLKANAESSPILVDKVGTYTYGCIHHFGMGQQGTIVAEP